MNRAEHLQWSKDRAMEYVRAGDNAQAYSSITSDLAKHEETQNLRDIAQLGMILLMGGHLDTEKQMTDWIQGFN